MGNFYTDVIARDHRFHTTKPIGDLALLEPVTRAKVQQIIADAAAKGIKLMVYETYRSQERQQLLFDQKASQLKTVGVHHYGLACDLVTSRRKIDVCSIVVNCARQNKARRVDRRCPLSLMMARSA
jgi:hypothetical protein